MTQFDWPALQAAWVPGDPLPCEPWMEAYYQVKFDVAKALQPASICEIGVRAGYSALAFLQACPRAQYLGLDSDEGMFGGITGYLQEARARLEPYNAVVMRCDTQDLPLDPETAAVMQGYELFHIDGDHSFKGALNDLWLAHNMGARWILLDDYDFSPEVRRAGQTFTQMLRAHYTTEYKGDGGHRGNLLYTRKAVA